MTLEHSHAHAQTSGRAVVLGAAGFVGGASATHLEAAGIETVRVGRGELDLLGDDAVAGLSEIIRDGDSLVLVSAKAPCKNWSMLEENIRMVATVCRTLDTVSLSHLVYVSSDAVYGDEPLPLTEKSPAAPGSLHGVMHLAREMMLADAVGDIPFAILRPTLIYGAADPHNGYGPNQFRRKAEAGEDIVLFGEGEERRDHVLVDDVAEIVSRVVTQRSHGILNVASGTVVSFREIADMVSGHFSPAPTIRGTPRNGPMPHNGYRPFDISACRDAFSDFEITAPEQGIKRVHEQTRAHT